MTVLVVAARPGGCDPGEQVGRPPSSPHCMRARPRYIRPEARQRRARRPAPPSPSRPRPGRGPPPRDRVDQEHAVVVQRRGQRRAVAGGSSSRTARSAEADAAAACRSVHCCSDAVARARPSAAGSPSPRASDHQPRLRPGPPRAAGCSGAGSTRRPRGAPRAAREPAAARRRSASSYSVAAWSARRRRPPGGPPPGRRATTVASSPARTAWWTIRAGSDSGRAVAHAPRARGPRSGRWPPSPLDRAARELVAEGQRVGAHLQHAARSASATTARSPSRALASGSSTWDGTTASCSSAPGGRSEPADPGEDRVHDRDGHRLGGTPSRRRPMRASPRRRTGCRR